MSTLMVWCCGIAFSASLLALTRNEEGELCLTFVADRRTHVVRYGDVDRIEVVR